MWVHCRSYWHCHLHSCSGMVFRVQVPRRTHVPRHTETYRDVPRRTETYRDVPRRTEAATPLCPLCLKDSRRPPLHSIGIGVTLPPARAAVVVKSVPLVQSVVRGTPGTRATAIARSRPLKHRTTPRWPVPRQIVQLDAARAVRLRRSGERAVRMPRGQAACRRRKIGLTLDGVFPEAPRSSRGPTVGVVRLPDWRRVGGGRLMVLLLRMARPLVLERAPGGLLVIGRRLRASPENRSPQRRSQRQLQRSPHGNHGPSHKRERGKHAAQCNHHNRRHGGVVVEACAVRSVDSPARHRSGRPPRGCDRSFLLGDVADQEAVPEGFGQTRQRFGWQQRQRHKTAQESNAEEVCTRCLGRAHGDRSRRKRPEPRRRRLRSPPTPRSHRPARAM